MKRSRLSPPSLLPIPLAGPGFCRSDTDRGCGPAPFCRGPGAAAGAGGRDEVLAAGRGGGSPDFGGGAGRALRAEPEGAGLLHGGRGAG